MSNEHPLFKKLLDPVRPPFPAPKCGHRYCNPNGCRFADTPPLPAPAPPPREPWPTTWPDFRDGGDPRDRHRPEHDQDPFGRPLKPGT